jgi:AcrR family transcriptional regulator
MSTSFSAEAAIAELAAGAVTRKPRQGRSQASYERMLATTRQLMLERGSEDFTLQDVSERGSVSIGSIYLRFESKDNLLHAVIAEELERLSQDEHQMIDAVLAKSSRLGDFLPLFLDSYYDVLQRHAPFLRLIMARAAFDASVSEAGKLTAHKSADASVAAILTFSGEIASNDPGRRASAAFQVLFATIARFLSLGSTAESADGGDWHMLKGELATMCIAYLKH